MLVFAEERKGAGRILSNTQCLRFKKQTTGQISIIPKAECFGDFGEVPLLNHHLGWIPSAGFTSL